MLRQTEYRIFSEKLPEAFDGYRIVQLSDLHGARYGEAQSGLIQAALANRPDLVVMTGDMTDNTAGAIDAALAVCRGLAGEVPVYDILGNHELTLKGDILPEYLGRLRDAGVQVLRNEHRILARGGAEVVLYGLETPIVYYKNPFAEYRKDAYFSVQDTHKMLGEADAQHYSILLAHDPIYYPSYRDWGADLTLSGHMHGGVINLPFLGGVLSPDRTLFPKYDAGHFTENGRELIVSRGLGNHFLIRVRNPVEVVTIILRKC
jgi:hypothetical protein